jgi:hypothetical protein
MLVIKYRSSANRFTPDTALVYLYVDSSALSKPASGPSVPLRFAAYAGAIELDELRLRS